MIDEYYPKFNADGLEVVKMTDAQKYLFDLKGWIALVFTALVATGIGHAGFYYLITKY